MIENTKEALMWKVPFRAIYCDTFASMLRYTFWCHAVIRVFPNAVDLASDALAASYRDRPEMMYEQYRSMLRVAS